MYLALELVLLFGGGILLIELPSLNTFLLICISGIIFTSPRAVRAVACIKDVTSLLRGWQNHPVFVVGEGTSNIVKKVLHLDGKGSSAGNASALADIILQSEL
jgi:uroporphyrinogen-III synthase